MDQKSLETVFSIAICRQSGDNWQSKTLVSNEFYQRSSIVLTFSKKKKKKTGASLGKLPFQLAVKVLSSCSGTSSELS